MDDILAAESRLDNINSVEPILGALRTVSHGSWQKAKSKANAVYQYSQQIRQMTASLVEGWSVRSDQEDDEGEEDRSEEKENNLVIIAIGSESGLCGQFNPYIFDSVHQLIREKETQYRNIHIWGIGSRLVRQLSREEINPQKTMSFSSGTLPSLTMALELSNALFSEYEQERIDGAIVLHNYNLGAGRLRTRMVQLLPASKFLERADHSKTVKKAAWPAPIVQTDQVGLVSRLIEHGITIQLYEMLLVSTAAENASRFFLMEEAAHNVERLIDELKIVVQIHRQQQITQEMTELAAGSGLMKLD